MPDTLTLEMGWYRGRRFILSARMSPTFDESKEWAIVLHGRSSGGSSVEIVTVDNAHGEAHIHRRYRRDDPTEAVEWGPWEAMAHLKRHWRRYAESYVSASRD